MKTVLLVDDEAHILRVLKLSLDSGGYRTLTARDGKGGLALALEALPDAVITDIQMPHMNGRELVQALDRALPNRKFPVFVMTSLVAREEREWVRGIANVHFLEKPISARQLVAHLDRHFAQMASDAGAANG